MSVVATITGRGQITIPSHVRKLLGLSAGKKVMISHVDETLSVQLLPDTLDVMSLYASVKSKKKSTSTEIATTTSKKIKAKKTVKQLYE